MSTDNTLTTKPVFTKGFMSLIVLLTILMFFITYTNQSTTQDNSQPVAKTLQVYKHATSFILGDNLVAVAFGYEQCSDVNLKQCISKESPKMKVRLLMSDGSVLLETWRVIDNKIFRPDGSSVKIK